MARLLAKLPTATDFISLAVAICDEASEWDIRQCAAILHGTDTQPVVLVDNFPDLSDSQRLGCAARFDAHPHYRAMVEHLGPAGEFFPVLSTSGLVGSIQLARTQPFSDELRRDLATMATQVSVRFAQLGIVPVPRDAARDPLTPHQREVAQLAAKGHTNDEIAAVLAISPNTVKKHLKDVFVRLDVNNRTELANLLARAMPPVDVPVGITRLPTVTVTRLR